MSMSRLGLGWSLEMRYYGGIGGLSVKSWRLSSDTDLTDSSFAGSSSEARWTVEKRCRLVEEE